MINLKHLELQNFFSHVDTSLSIEDYKGLVLVEGITSDGHYSSNGSGKSTLLEGIVYALSGETLRGVSVNDVVNRNYNKNTKVSLQFNKAGDNYTVRRYRKDDNFGDSLILYKGEENISKRVNKETQKSLEDILCISYRVLISTMLLGEGLSSRFTQLSDPEKKSLIESTLNLNYDMNSIRAKANSQLSQLKLDLSNLEGRLSTLQELSSMDIEFTKKLLAEKEESSAKASKELEELKAALAGIQASREPLEQKINLLRDTLNNRSILESELKRLDDEVLIYVKELEKLESRDSIPHCALCNQPLSSGESVESVRNNYKEKVTSIHSRMLDIQSQLTSLPEESIIREKYDSLSVELNSITDSQNNYTLRIGELSNTYWSLQSSINFHTSEIKRYEENTSDISSLETEKKKLLDDIEKYKYFYDLFSPTGIIVNILSEAIEYINGRLSTYSEVLLEKDYKINFVKGKISLVDSSGASYQSLSNGEKRRLDISIQFALHDYVHTYCGMSMDTLFIDEILDTLDDIGVDNIFEVLRLKLEYCHLNSIYVITHNDALKDKFDQVITVSKNNLGDSYLI